MSDAEADRRQHPKSGEMPTAALFLEQSPGQGIVLPRVEGCCRQKTDESDFSFITLLKHSEEKK